MHETSATKADECIELRVVIELTMKQCCISCAEAINRIHFIGQQTAIVCFPADQAFDAHSVIRYLSLVCLLEILFNEAALSNIVPSDVNVN